VNLDMHRLLSTLRSVLEQQIVETQIGRILMPGPTYLGIWARDTGIVSLGLARLGRADLAGELLQRYWSYQITPESDPGTFIFRNKRIADWTEDHAYRPTAQELRHESGAFPTSVYIRTPDFPAGTREIYSNRADPDSACWLIIALYDQYLHCGDDALLREFSSGVTAAIRYLCSRDIDGDHLLEQGPNQDWADILLRRGRVSYTQAVWFRCLEAAAGIFTVLDDEAQADRCRRIRVEVGEAINRVLLTRHGYYANYVASDRVSLRRSLDTALLVAFGVCDPEVGRQVLTMLSTLDGPFGYSVVEPGYAPEVIGPSKYPPGQYQNEGIWPWISAYLALAWARLGEQDRARAVVESLFPNQPDTMHEWIDNLTGEAHHPDFATAAGALAWVITEAGLAT
jgi:glycogen debranching enzyme